MQKSNLLSMSSSQHTKTMLYSRIQPEHNQKNIKDEYINHKIPKADKKTFQNFQVRAGIVHSNVARTIIQQKSPFYNSVYIQKCQVFGIKDLLILPINKRILLLVEILSAVKELAKLYGFFYITEKMLGYKLTGKITVWIHENLIENKRKHPINHGKLSEDIFVSDFKAGFGGNLRHLSQFQRVKTIDGLVSLLNQNTKVAQSIYLSEPAYKQSQIHRRNSQLTLSDMDERQSFNSNDKGIVKNMFKFNKDRGLKKTESLNSFRKPISFSYLPNQLEKSMIGSSKIIPVKTLNSSASMQRLNFRYPQPYNILYKSNRELAFSKILQSYTNQKGLAKSTIPKIQFSYQNNDIRESWKKKPNTFSKIDLAQSRAIIKSQSAKNLAFQTQQMHKQSLKVSFPHTTTHTFVPFASNGNISLAFKESANLQRKGIRINKQDLVDTESQVEPHISEDSNEVEMDLDVLFSDDEELHSRQEAQQLQMIMEQFENVLLS